MVVVPEQNLKTMIGGTTQRFQQLPLVHTTKTETFLSMVRGSKILSPHKCPVYKEDINYLFYGRPAYKIFPGMGNSSLSTFKPVTILFEPNAIADDEVARVMPFDSGAFRADLYGGVIGSTMSLDDFEIGDNLDAANCFVSRAFDSNEQYYLGRMRPDFLPLATNLPGQSYRTIVDYAGETAVDDRRSTVEIQCTSQIELSRENVIAVSLPSEYLDDKALFDFLKMELECEILGYDTYQCTASNDVRDITVRVKTYLDKEGLLRP